MLPNPPMYGMNTRFLPSMLEPRYHDDSRPEEQRPLGRLGDVRGPRLRGIASRLDLGDPPIASASTISSTAQSTCTSACSTMFASTDGLPGPLKLNRFGSRGTITPRNVTGPSAQISDSRSPSGPIRVDPRHRARQRVETRCEHQHIAVVGRLSPSAHRPR